jgi:hypothetical protein
MNYHLESELGTILYNIDQQQIKLDLLLTKNKKELIELDIFDKIKNGCNFIDDGINSINEVF